MAKQFSGSDVVEFAIQIEVNGKKFYEQCIKNSTNQKVKSVFQVLADEEESHIKTFQDLLKSIQKYDPEDAFPEEYCLYMKSIADEHIFTKNSTFGNVSKYVQDDFQVLDLAKKFEKDSVSFYEAMLKMVFESDKEIVQSLINEEKEHFQKLSRLQEDLK